MSAASIGVLGGTFDPVHHGHLRLATELAERLALDGVRLVPARVPPHRGAPRAPSETRRRMLAAAVGGVPGFEVDERELRREGPSYMVETLASLRDDHPSAALWLLLGMDAFAALDTWHRWGDLPGLANIAVARRPGACAPAAGAVARLLDERRGKGTRGAAAGSIVIVDIPRLEISSSAIRAMIASGRSPRFLLPNAVLDIIESEELYTHAE